MFTDTKAVWNGSEQKAGGDPGCGRQRLGGEGGRRGKEGNKEGKEEQKKTTLWLGLGSIMLAIAGGGASKFAASTNGQEGSAKTLGKPICRFHSE